VESIKNQNLSRVVVKASAYNLVSLLVLKFGGLIFTIIIARMLLPELFGVYALIFSIVTIILTFTDLGIDNTFLRYLSDSVGKRNKKLSRGYFKYIFKIKCFLIFFSVVLLLIISKYLSYSVYKNPILFYPLLFSCLFIISESLRSFLGNLFIAKKDFKFPVFLDASLQILKIFFSVFAILIFTDSLKISGLFLAFFASSFLTLILMFFVLLKKDKSILFGETKEIDKSKINSYWKYMIFASVSLAFFASIDTLMLGKFVSPEYIGYYRAVMSLVVAIASVFSLTWAFFPVFTQIKGSRFHRGFNKILRYTLILSIPATAGIIFIAKYLIKAVYGNEYLLGTTSLYFLALLIITTPLIGLYSIIFQSKEKPKIVSNAVLFSLVANIILNILAIYLFKNNPLFIIAGVGLATSLSRALLLGLLIFYAKKEFSFSVKGIGLRAPLFATLIMSAFLLSFNYLVNMNIFFGAIEIILGAGIYAGCLILLKGVNKEDFELIKGLFKRR
jgi:O-antigen/teichoic acid export membrane protein